MLDSDLLWLGASTVLLLFTQQINHSHTVIGSKPPPTFDKGIP